MCWSSKNYKSVQLPGTILGQKEIGILNPIIWPLTSFMPLVFLYTPTTENLIRMFVGGTKETSGIKWVELASRHTTLFQRPQDVYTTLATSHRRLMDVDTKLCVYWVKIIVILMRLNSHCFYLFIHLFIYFKDKNFLYFKVESEGCRFKLHWYLNGLRNRTSLRGSH